MPSTASHVSIEMDSLRSQKRQRPDSPEYIGRNSLNDDVEGSGKPQVTPAATGGESSDKPDQGSQPVEHPSKFPDIHRERPRRKETLLPGFMPQQARYTGAGVYDYEAMFPKDKPGEEMGPNARVWHVYMNEADMYDQDMIQGFRDSVDASLVFAALFSAVVTTFVVQTSQSFQPDYGRITAAATLEMLALQRATSNGSKPSDVLSSGITLDSVDYNSMDVWINAVWFASLALSLAAALMSILVRQWLQEYTRVLSGTAKDRALNRQFRFSGMLKWKFSTFVGLLPIILHLSLGLFTAGLAMFAWSLLPLLSYAIIVVACLSLLVYAGTILLAATFEGCPYRVPILSTPLSYPIRGLKEGLTTVISKTHKNLQRQLWWHRSRTRRPLLTNFHSKYSGQFDAMMWLHSCSTNQAVSHISVQALNGLDGEGSIAFALSGYNSAFLCTLIDVLLVAVDCGDDAMSKRLTSVINTLADYADKTSHTQSTSAISNALQTVHASSRSRKTYYYQLLLLLTSGKFLGETTFLEKLLHQEAMRYGDRTLCIASEYGETLVAQWLLDRGARVDSEDDAGDPALHLAATYDHVEVLSLLLKKGADIDKRRTERQCTGLTFAARDSGEQVVSQFLHHSSKSINDKDGTGMTPLHWAAWRGSKRIVNVLLQHNADPSIKNNEGETALDMARNSEWPNPSLVEQLQNLSKAV